MTGRLAAMRSFRMAFALAGYFRTFNRMGAELEFGVAAIFLNIAEFAASGFGLPSSWTRVPIRGQCCRIDVGADRW